MKKKLPFLTSKNENTDDLTFCGTVLHFIQLGLLIWYAKSSFLVKFNLVHLFLPFSVIIILVHV